MIDHDVLQQTLAHAVRSGGEFAEVFAEDRRSASAMLDDSRVENISSGRRRGVGIRVVVGDSTGFAHTADLTPAGLMAAADRAASGAHGGGGVEAPTALERRTGTDVGHVRVLPEEIATEAKVDLLRRADDAARTAGDSIKQVTARYAEGRRRILVANTDGVWAEDDQVRTLFSVNAVALGDGGMQTGRETVGHTVGFELFDEHDVAEMARRAADRAVAKLAARPAPSGEVPVVIARGGGGVLFHEACGHGLEADFIRKGASVYTDRLGEQVAAPMITLVDDGTMAKEWGALSIDDEGAPSAYNTLIEDGILTDYMWDLLRARSAGRPQSGNGRRESYEHLPMVRMTNTYVLNGDAEPDDIIADTPSGVYIAQLGGGSVNTTTGDFVFGMTESYLIEDGKITEPLREGNLIGNGPKVLQDIVVVGNDFAMGSPGTCGKNGQGVPVGDGQPTLRVTGMTVGGTAA